LMNSIRSLQIFKDQDLLKFGRFAFGSLASYFLIYVVNFLINRNLEPNQLALFSYNTHLLNLFFPIVSLNVYSAYLRFWSRFNDRELIRFVTKVSVFATIFFALIIYLVFANVYFILYAAIIMFNERTYFFRSMEEIKRHNLLKYINNFLLICLILSFIVFKNLNFETIILGYGICYLLSSIVGFSRPFTKKLNYRNEPPLPRKQVVKFVAPLMFNGILLWLLLVSDQIIIKHYLSLNELAKYAIAYRVLSILKLFTGLFFLYWPIFYFREMEKRNARRIRVVRRWIVFLIFAFLLASIMVNKILYVVFGAGKYKQFSYLFVILVMAEFLRIFGSLNLTYRSFMIQNHFNLIILILSVLVNVVLNLVFIKTYGVVFAAYSTLIACGLYFIFSFFFSTLAERKYLTN